jgi:hypothetical protein
MAFVPEGQHDRSQARSAWDSAPQKNRPVGYGMIGRASDPTGISRRNVRRVSLGRPNTLLERFVSDDDRAAAQSNGAFLRDTDAEDAISRCQFIA